MADKSDSWFDATFDRVVTQTLGTPEVPRADIDLLVEAGLDSVKFVGLLMELEDEFGGFWPAEQLSCFANLAKIDVLRSAAKEQLWTMSGEAANPLSSPRDE